MGHWSILRTVVVVVVVVGGGGRREEEDNERSISCLWVVSSSCRSISNGSRSSSRSGGGC